MTALIHVVSLSLSAILTAGLAGAVWRRRDRPGARSFVALLLVITVWTAGYAVGLSTLAPRWRLVWEGVQWFGIAFVPLALFLFVLEYSGNDEVLSVRSVATLCAIPIATVVLVWTNSLHHLIWTDSTIVVSGGVAVVSQDFGPWYWVNLLYAYLLIGVSLFFLVRSLWSSDETVRAQSALLLAGIAVPLVSNLLSVFGVAPIQGLDLTPYAFTVTGLLFAAALFGHRLLELVPASVTVGRDVALDGLPDGVFLTDVDDRVVYVNDAAAAAFDCDPESVVGQSVASLMGDADADGVAAADGFRTLALDDRSYEVRRTPVTSSRGHDVGYSYLVRDVTARERRIDQLRRQRREVEALNSLNTLIRDVNQALVTATTRLEVEDVVCRRLEASSLYDSATTEGVDVVGTDAGRARSTRTDGSGDVRSFTAPLVFGSTTYGRLRVTTSRPSAFDDRERAVLTELGETVGMALNAAESRKLLVADTVVELDIQSTDDGSACVAVSRRTACRLDLVGLVPAPGGNLVAYVGVEDAPVDEVHAAFADAPNVDEARVIDPDDGVVECTLSGGSLLLSVVEYGANVRTVEADRGTLSALVEVEPGADVRGLIDGLRDSFPDTVLLAKRERARPDDAGDADADVDLTDRQRESLEAAFHAGYFEWPRESTAEEVAESMGVSPPTLHNHLRKAQNALVTDFFDDADDRPASE